MNFQRRFASSIKVIPNPYTSWDTLINVNEEYLTKTPEKRFVFNNIHPQFLCRPFPMQVEHYESDILPNILLWLLKQEKKIKKTIILDQQSKCSEADRATIINWLMKVQNTFDLNSEIYFSTVRIFDYILIFFNIPKNMLQLTIVTVLWICYKFYSRHIVTVDILNKLCNDAYCKVQFLEMEKVFLTFYDFSIDCSSSYISFLNYYLHRLGLPNCKKIFCAAEYFLQCYTLSPDSSKRYPSTLAASAIYLAFTLFPEPTDVCGKNKLMLVCRYCENLLRELANRMLTTVKLVHAPNSPYSQVCLNFAVQEKMGISVAIHFLLQN